ncbi:hypothetical protein M3J09_004168 [Ascochyta lentis]
MARCVARIEGRFFASLIGYARPAVLESDYWYRKLTRSIPALGMKSPRLSSRSATPSTGGEVAPIYGPFTSWSQH